MSKWFLADRAFLHMSLLDRYMCNVRIYFPLVFDTCRTMLVALTRSMRIEYNTFPARHSASNSLRFWHASELISAPQCEPYCPWTCEKHDRARGGNFSTSSRPYAEDDGLGDWQCNHREAENRGLCAEFHSWSTALDLRLVEISPCNRLSWSF